MRARRPGSGIPYRPARIGGRNKTAAEIAQQMAETEARIAQRLYEVMWPARKPLQVVNCEDYDPLGDG